MLEAFFMLFLITIVLALVSLAAAWISEKVSCFMDRLFPPAKKD